ncbi:hypothetical protein COCNU_10G006340 [Cocos nucifera]|uniref:Uncharacterized protein n=1 Tax=Cocos nucifera TaxID=13894 RepID=A0A8K0ILU1_COCNU|nr:hypothetical protein COCNU_10G006340 [Cocos nucifera]
MPVDDGGDRMREGGVMGTDSERRSQWRVKEEEAGSGDGGPPPPPIGIISRKEVERKPRKEGSLLHLIGYKRLGLTKWAKLARGNAQLIFLGHRVGLGPCCLFFLLLFD